MGVLANTAGAYHVVVRPIGLTALLVGMVASSSGCNAIINGWLDPTVVGAFDRNRTSEIRTSLTLEDTPPGIPGAEYPAPIDRILIEEEYPISSGDTLIIEIDELRQRDSVFQTQAVVSSIGYVNLPVVGRVHAAGNTLPQFEAALIEALRDRDILLAPTVAVNPLFLHNATYSIFGIGVSASNNAPLRAGTFPIRYPGLRVLEAINQVGGLNEFVSDIYLFRTYEPPSDVTVSAAASHIGIQGGSTHAPATISADDDARPAPLDDEQSPEQELFDAVAGGDEPVEVDRTPAPDEESDIPADLEPDPTQPFLWDNVAGEFVPNPAYAPRAAEEAPSGTEPLPFMDTVTPAVSWARIAGETAYRILRIPAETLRTGDPEVNIYVRPGDVIRIVSGEIGVYYVMGQVNQVGTFRFNAESITVKAAIAAAGGLSGLAWPDRCTVYRRLGQREQMIQVNLDRIFAGKDPDFIIRRGDIINVGTHPFAPFLQRIRAFTLPNPTTNVGYGFTYARNYADIDSFAVKRNPHNEEDTFPNLFP